MIPPFSLLRFLYFISLSFFLQPFCLERARGVSQIFLAALLSRHKKIPVTEQFAAAKVTGILFYISRLGIIRENQIPRLIGPESAVYAVNSRLHISQD